MASPIRRTTVAVAVVVGLVLVGCSSGSASSSSSTGAPAELGAGATITRPGATTTTADPLAPTKAAKAYGVGSRSLTVVDTSRPTAASPKRNRPARTSRTLPLFVLYPSSASSATDTPVEGAPVADGRFPIFEFSHGITATGPAYAGFLQRIAAAGYVVVAPTFPLTSGGADAWQDLGDYKNQPGDVSFAIDEITKLDTLTGDPLAGHLATKAIAVGGHSLGAITTLGFFNSCCRDARVKAAVAVSGLRLPYPNGTFSQPRDLPLLLMHGKKDGTVPYSGSASTFKDFTGPRALLTLPAADHVEPIFGKDGDATVASVVAFLDRELRADDTRWKALDRELVRIDRGTLAVGGGLAAPG